MKKKNLFGLMVLFCSLNAALVSPSKDKSNNSWKKLSDAITDYSGRMQKEIFDTFKKEELGEREQKASKEKVKLPAKISAVVEEIFDQYVGLGHFRQLTVLPEGMRIYNKMRFEIEDDVKNILLWNLSRLSYTEENTRKILKMLNDIKSALISLYCKLVVNLQQITGKNYSTINFKSNQIVFQDWFKKMAEELKKELCELLLQEKENRENLLKTEKNLQPSESLDAIKNLDQILEKGINADVYAFEHSAFFGASLEEVKRIAEKEKELLKSKNEKNFEAMYKSI
jgi:hypothetical protein